MSERQGMDMYFSCPLTTRDLRMFAGINFEKSKFAIVGRVPCIPSDPVQHSKAQKSSKHNTKPNNGTHQTGTTQDPRGRR
jgi:hypothetical protein